MTVAGVRAERDRVGAGLVPQDVSFSRCCRIERVQCCHLPVEKNSKKCSAKTGHY